MILVDRSQQVMTIIGVIANMGTSITLIKNGQVGVTSDTKRYGGIWFNKWTSVTSGSQLVYV